MPCQSRTVPPVSKASTLTAFLSAPFAFRAPGVPATPAMLGATAQPLNIRALGRHEYGPDHRGDVDDRRTEDQTEDPAPDVGLYGFDLSLQPQLGIDRHYPPPASPHHPGTGQAPVRSHRMGGDRAASDGMPAARSMTLRRRSGASLIGGINSLIRGINSRFGGIISRFARIGNSLRCIPKDQWVGGPNVPVNRPDSAIFPVCSRRTGNQRAPPMSRRQNPSGQSTRSTAV